MKSPSLDVIKQRRQVVENEHVRVVQRTLLLEKQLEQSRREMAQLEGALMEIDNLLGQDESTPARNGSVPAETVVSG